MTCPACGGTDRQEIGPERWQCTTQRIVNLVPYGLGGNFSAPAGIPIFGPCGRVYDADEERAVDVWRAQEYARQQQAAAENARRVAEREERHREQVAENERFYGPAGPLREQVAAMDARLRETPTYPDGDEAALGGLVLGGVALYVSLVRSRPSAVGGQPDWLPRFLLEMPSWVPWSLTVLFLGIAAAWAVVFLRNPPEPSWGEVAGGWLILAVPGVYLVLLRWRPSPVGDPPSWLPSVFLTMPDWVPRAFTGVCLACVLAWPVTRLRYHVVQQSLAELRARRDALERQIGCGETTCETCMGRRRGTVDPTA